MMPAVLLEIANRMREIESRTNDYDNDKDWRKLKKIYDVALKARAIEVLDYYENVRVTKDEKKIKEIKKYVEETENVEM